MSRSTLASKGQTTIPKDVRKPFTLPLENPLEYVIDDEWSGAGAAGDDRSRDTDRPETITIGTNELIGTDPSKLPPALARLMAEQWSPTALAYSTEVASAMKAGQPWSHSYLWRNPPKLQRRRVEKGAIPPKWDGKAAERIVEHLERLLAGT